MKKLLIVGCSKRKVSVSGPVPALELYDGPLFRVIRKSMQEGWFPGDTCVYIVSAKYGLISGESLIEWYDAKLTGRGSAELRQGVGDALEKLLDSQVFAEAFICMGRDYLDLIGGTSPFCRRSIPATLAQGGIGERCSQLKAWLRQVCVTCEERSRSE